MMGIQGPPSPGVVVGTLSNRLTPVFAVVLAGLLGFSPTADLLTGGASRIVISRSAQAAACPQIERDTCGEVPIPGCCGVGEASPEVPVCRPEATTSASRCAGEPGTRPCGQCFFVGGLLLFAVAEPSHDPDLQLLGRVASGDPPSVLRFLTPPVPPPIDNPDARV
jgi:hypothetical protein